MDYIILGVGGVEDYGGGDLLISREMWILLNFGDISFIILATRKVRFVLPKKKKINPHIRLIC